MSLLKRPLFYVVILLALVIILVMAIIIVSSPSQLSNNKQKPITQKPAAANPTNAKPGSCLILEEKYCKTVKFIPDPRFPDQILAVYKIDKGVKLFSPFEGIIHVAKTFFYKSPDKNNAVSYKALAVYDNIPPTKTNWLDFNLTFDNTFDASFNDVHIKNGATIGSLTDKNIDFVGNYNLVVKVTKIEVKDQALIPSSGDDILIQYLTPK
jgi:hypothetical protein